MNERNPITEWTTSLKQLLGDIGGIALLGVFVGCLVAPLFSGLFESQMVRKANGTFVTPTQLLDVEKKMVLVKIMLWIVCIGAWSLLILANLF